MDTPPEEHPTPKVKKTKNQLTGQIGEALVVAELGRRGFVATSFTNNVPEIDLLAYKDGKTLAIQVKAWRVDSGQFNAGDFLHLEWEGDYQKINGLKQVVKEPIYVFVRIADFPPTEKNSMDQFYILTKVDLQKIIYQNHQECLARHNGIRPKNSQSPHCSAKLEDLHQFRDNWELIDEGLKA